ncbi:hypothetical protein PDJAM_G00107900 [Pangasius djambal]|uniref:Uncharacterized protein n=1 Tax=Pangasius djambal TaxID=1691987 RepID=A0ACC5Y2K3_9TELE|nr:hypothetical protein [Pangasius djambal]
MKSIFPYRENVELQSLYWVAVHEQTACFLTAATLQPVQHHGQLLGRKWPSALVHFIERDPLRSAPPARPRHCLARALSPTTPAPPPPLLRAVIGQPEPRQGASHRRSARAERLRCLSHPESAACSLGRRTLSTAPQFHPLLHQ